MFDIIEPIFRSTKSQYFFGDSKKLLSRAESRELSYRIAHGMQLVAPGIAKTPDGKQLCVAIYLPRDVNYLATIFACWLSGHYYVPLNITWPKEHLNKIIAAAKPDLIIGEKNDDCDFDCTEINTLVEAPLPSDETLHRWKHDSQEVGLAYIVFTSGSTGQQKGVMIAKSAIRSYILWTGAAFKDFRTNRAILQNGEMNFDISLADIALALALDLELHIAPAPRNFLSQAKMIKERKIDTFYGVPTTLSSLLSWLKTRDDVDLGEMKLVLSGGDVLTPALVKLVVEVCSSAAFYNMYGPTEFTVNCLYTRVDDKLEQIHIDDAVPTGRILEHLEYRLIDPGGTEGGGSTEERELLVSGSQMMEGYLDDPDKTAEVQVQLEGQTFYRTGDLFFETSDGLLIYRGRTDSIEKVRGYRINSVSITNTIASLAGVAEVSALVCTDSNASKSIVAFVAGSANGDENICKDVISHCEEHLPSYMVPNRVIELRQLPISINGKIDHKRLREMADERS